MSTAVSSRLFVPPYPPRSDRPLGALATILTLWRNPLEIWGQAHFERPDPDRPVHPRPARRRPRPGGGQAHLPRQRRQLPQGRSAAQDPEPGSRQWPGDGGGRSLAPAAPVARAAVLAARSRGLRPGDAARGGGDRRAAQAPARRRGRRRRRTHVRTSRSKVLEQTLFSQGLGREAERVSARRDRLFRQFRPPRPARPHRRACLSAPVRPAARAARAEILRFGGRRHHREPQAPARRRRRRPARYPDAAARRQGPGDGPRPARRRHSRQHRHVHLCRTRDDRQRPDLDALPPVAGPGLAPTRRAGGGAGRSIRRGRRPSRIARSFAPCSRRRSGSIRRPPR